MAEQQFHTIRQQTEAIPLNMFSHLKALAFLAFAVLWPLRFSVGTLILAGVLLDMLRKFGSPRCSKLYFSHIALDDDLHSLTLVLFTNFVNNFVFTIPVYIFIFQGLVAYLFQLYSSRQGLPLAGVLFPQV